MTDFPAFVEASRKGQLVSLFDLQNRFSLGASWAIPQFHFGRFWKADDTPLWGDLVDEMSEILRTGDLKLPFDRCVYSFEPPNRPSQYVALEQTEEGLKITAFVHLKGKWFCSPEPVEIYENADWLGADGGFKSGLHLPEGYEAGESLAEAMYHMVALAIMGTILLDNTLMGVDREAVPSPQLPFVNAGRARAGHPPLPPTIRLRLDVDRVRRSYRNRATHPTGLQKQPHYRRGHKRRLPGGKIIWVKHCSIHGGAAPARTYLVQSGSVANDPDAIDYSYVHFAEGRFG